MEKKYVDLKKPTGKVRKVFIKLHMVCFPGGCQGIYIMVVAILWYWVDQVMSPLAQQPNVYLMNQCICHFSIWRMYFWRVLPQKIVPYPGKIYGSNYCTLAIISRGLYIFYPIFHWNLYCRALVLQTTYVLNKEILQFLRLKSPVYNW